MLNVIRQAQETEPFANLGQFAVMADAPVRALRDTADHETARSGSDKRIWAAADLRPSMSSLPIRLPLRHCEDRCNIQAKHAIRRRFARIALCLATVGLHAPETPL